MDFPTAQKLVEKHRSAIQSTVLLNLYAFYKQATVGSCTIPRPSFFEFEARAKWDAWNAINGMTADQGINVPDSVNNNDDDSLYG